MELLQLTRVECLFCKIVARETQAPVVWENAATLVFLDHRPVFPGHCLLVPKVHCETLGDLAAESVEPLFGSARRLARAVESGMQAEGTFVAINNRVSQSVPHLHVHVVPRNRKDGLRGFFWPRTKYASDEEMERARSAIAAAMAVEA